ncbi:hypothetical protein CI109_104778 [Kwoniella shandongensis]|uniref:DUS-like FMN-binding domain-containing protein n=1 Tax=Kwoniella shandongensis TaxID=1734106 RepID=A0AAJ8LM46_9TREE
MPVATPRSSSPEGPVRDAKRRKVTTNASTSAPTGEEFEINAPSEAKQDKQPDNRTEEELVEEQMSLPIEFPKSYERELEYREKLVLAPMVRTGSLPMRLLSLYYGAGLVWSPEVVDKAIIGAERTVDLIFQIGSSNPELAVKAAQTVQQDVAGITHSGMGAALLSTPDILLNILRALLDTIPLPISCKIRLLPTQPSTMYLASRILRTGIRNLTVHCRTRDMRSGERALWERLGDIVALGKRRNIPITCNGDGEGWANWEKIRTVTGLAEYTKNPWGNTKFLLMQFKPSPAPISNISKSERKQINEVISRSKSLEEVAAGLKVPIGHGKEVFDDIAAKIQQTVNGDIFEERRVAEEKGETVDEMTTIEPAAEEDGFEVGIGQAQSAQT